MASVLPRRSASGVVSWRVQFRHEGRHAQKTFKLERGAREFGALVDKVGADAALQVLEARNNTTGDMPTLREWTHRYLDPASGLLTGIEEGTRAGYERAARNSFLVMLGEYPVSAIDKAAVGRWITWQEQQPSRRQKGKLIAPKTVRNYHSILSSVLACAVNEGLRPDNPAYRTKLTRGIQHEGVYLSPDEVATILAFIHDRYEPLVLFLYGTGCRWGEATAITWGDLNLRANPPTVRISKAWKKGPTGAPILKQPKSARGRRTISLPHDVVAALGTPGPADQLVFRGELSGRHLWYGRFRTTTWNPAIEKAMDAELCERHGLQPLSRRPTPHDLRHSHASGLIARGVPLTELQRRLGHESIQTTSNTYGHLSPDSHIRMADVATDMLNGVRHLRELV